MSRNPHDPRHAGRCVLCFTDKGDLGPDDVCRGCSSELGVLIPDLYLVTAPPEEERAEIDSRIAVVRALKRRAAERHGNDMADRDELDEALPGHGWSSQRENVNRSHRSRGGRPSKTSPGGGRAGVRGVCATRYGTYEVAIVRKGVRYRLGTYPTLEQAAAVAEAFYQGRAS